MDICRHIQIAVIGLWGQFTKSPRALLRVAQILKEMDDRDFVVKMATEAIDTPNPRFSGDWRNPEDVQRMKAKAPTIKNGMVWCEVMTEFLELERQPHH